MLYETTLKNGMRRLVVACASFLLSFAPAFTQQRDALAEYRAGNYENAVLICRAEIISDPSNLDAHIVLCRSLLKLNRYFQALAVAESAEKISRYDVRVIEILGETNFFSGQNSNALKYFQEYTHLAPEGRSIDAAYYFMGEIYIRLGRFKRADIAISTSLHYYPEIAYRWARLAYAREMAGEYGESVRAYKKALELDSAMHDAKIGLERVSKAMNNR